MDLIDAILKAECSWEDTQTSITHIDTPSVIGHDAHTVHAIESHVPPQVRQFLPQSQAKMETLPSSGKNVYDGCMPYLSLDHLIADLAPAALASPQHREPQSWVLPQAPPVGQTNQATRQLPACLPYQSQLNASHTHHTAAQHTPHAELSYPRPATQWQPNVASPIRKQQIPSTGGIPLASHATQSPWAIPSHQPWHNPIQFHPSIHHTNQNCAITTPSSIPSIPISTSSPLVSRQQPDASPVQQIGPIHTPTPLSHVSTSTPKIKPHKHKFKNIPPTTDPQKPKSKKRKQRPKESENDLPKPKRITGLSQLLLLSAPLVAITGVTELSRPEIVKALWSYIKTNNLQDPTDRRFIICDDKLKAVFHVDRINSFGMNKDLSAHVSKKPSAVTEATVAPTATSFVNYSAEALATTPANSDPASATPPQLASTSPAFTAETPSVATPSELEGWWLKQLSPEHLF